MDGSGVRSVEENAVFSTDSDFMLSRTNLRLHCDRP